MSDPSIQSQVFSNVPLGIIAALFILERGTKFALWVTDKFSKALNGEAFTKRGEAKVLEQFLDFIQKELLSMLGRIIDLLGVVHSENGQVLQKCNGTHEKVNKITELPKDIRIELDVFKTNMVSEFRKLNEQLSNIECVAMKKGNNG